MKDSPAYGFAYALTWGLIVLVLPQVLLWLCHT